VYVRSSTVASNLYAGFLPDDDPGLGIGDFLLLLSEMETQTIAHARLSQ